MFHRPSLFNRRINFLFLLVGFGRIHSDGFKLNHLEFSGPGTPPQKRLAFPIQGELVGPMVQFFPDLHGQPADFSDVCHINSIFSCRITEGVGQIRSNPEIIMASVLLLRNTVKGQLAVR